MDNKKEKLNELHKIMCASIHCNYDEFQGAMVIDTLITAENLIANGVAVQKWIPVTERLPEEDGEYITMTNAKGKCNGVLAQNFTTSMVRGKKIRRWVWHNRISPWITTHWMPLPEAQKEE